MAVAIRHFDAYRRRAGGSGMRGGAGACRSRSQGGRAVQGISDALAHGRGAGRRRGVARQRRRGQLALAHVRHGQGLRLPRRPGRDRVHVPQGARGGATSSSTSACRSTALDDGKIYQRPFGGHIDELRREVRCSARARRPTAPAMRCCTRSISATSARTRSSSSNGWRST